MHSVALGRKESLKNKKNDRWEENCSIEEKKKITEEIAVVTQKYEHFQKLYETLDSEFVCGIKLGEEKNNMTFLVKGNSLKRRSKEAFESLNQKCQKMQICLRKK